MNVYGLSGREKIELLGFNGDDFWSDVCKVDDLLAFDYSKDNLEKNVYPHLGVLKEKYGFNVPIDLFGVDVVRLGGVLTSALLRHGGKNAAQPKNK